MLLRSTLLALVTLSAACAATHGQRLPGGVHPEHYALTLTPDLQMARFTGSETIDLTLDAPAATITLNTAELAFVSVRGGVAGPNGAAPTEWQPAGVTLDPAKEQATLRFVKSLPAGRVTLAIEYTGILNNKLRGFYLSKTKLRNYAVTQFEATDARRAFPSFDEPALKATFDVALVVNKGDIAISNMNVISDKANPVEGKHTVTFATTPKMSTYLVAFLVGDFVCAEGKQDGVPIRACATPEKAGLTKFALDAGKFMLHYYDDYFGIKYPMPKLDMVALPDFEAGAMENFGCITYRETDMLVDAKFGSIPAKKEVAETIAHEMAHQWFGDLVTPAWWDNLWLNEGFATWMETKAAAKWHPEWRYEQSAADDLDSTLDLDAERKTRAIRARAETPAEINEMFDGIAYGKGGAVVSMVENYVGEEVFRHGVHNYLAAHLYGNATAEDFWDEQTRTSRLPVDKVMRSFVEQPGVPLVTLGGRAGATLPADQRRFFLSDGGPVQNSSAAEKWTIPICLKGGACSLLTPDDTSLAVPQGSLLYANAGDRGYYRTAYAPEQLAAIVAHAETELTPEERIGLLGDRWALMRAGQGSVGAFLDLMLALKTDANATVLDNALDKIAAIDAQIASQADRARLDAVVRAELGPVYAGMGKPQKHEPSDRAQIRGTLFEVLGEAGDPAVRTEAEAVTKELLLGHKLANPAITDAAVSLVAAQGGAEMYDKLLQVSRNATDPDLKSDALHTLTRFWERPLVARTLDYAVSDEVRSQDSWTLFALLLTQPETRDQAWEYVQQHWPSVKRRSTASSGSHIVAATGSFCTVEQRNQVVSFFAANPVESSERTLAKAVDSIDDCVRLRAAQEPNLRQWLDAHPQ